MHMDRMVEVVAIMVIVVATLDTVVVGVVVEVGIIPAQITWSAGLDQCLHSQFTGPSTELKRESYY